MLARDPEELFSRKLTLVMRPIPVEPRLFDSCSVAQTGSCADRILRIEKTPNGKESSKPSEQPTVHLSS
jgi:hypothetical protein